MGVQAKMYVSSIERFTYGDNIVVKLQAVTRKDEDNKTWATATPSGSVQLSINNKDAWPFFIEAFEKATDILLTFEAAPAG